MITIEAGNISITTPGSGRVLFDLSQSRLVGLRENASAARRIDGSRTFSTLQGDFQTHATSSNTFDLGAVHASATRVIGAVRVEWTSTANTGSIPSSGTSWWNYAGGNFVIYWHSGEVELGAGANQGYLKGTNRSDLSAWSQVRFRVTSGRLYLDEYRRVRGNISAPIYGPFVSQGFTLHWKLFPVTFI